MAINVEDNLKKLGVSEIKFYYKNCPVVGNIYTACVFMSEDKKLLSRGVAICSLSDSHDKEVARKLSLKRAKKALFKKGNSDQINSDFLRSKVIPCDLRKFFKIKNESFKTKLINQVKDLCFDFEEQKFNDFERLDVYIPYFHPIEETGKVFTYKSEYEPKATEEEIKMFRLG